jgi:hypothetical protein
MHLTAERGVSQEERPNGTGIGVFPTYACALGGKMIPLEVEPSRSFEILLSYHPVSGRISRVRHMIDWLVEAFSPAKYPWFKDEFVHPRDFKAVYMGEPLTHLFGGLLDRRTVDQNEQISGKEDEAAQCRQARH